jgi:hypothetical protein
MGIHRGLMPHPLVGAVPQRIRSWISYYTPDRALTMRDVERLRRSIIADMDPIYARQLSSVWEERSNRLISKADFDQRTLVAILRAVYLGLHREQQRLSSRWRNTSSINASVVICRSPRCPRRRLRRTNSASAPSAVSTNVSSWSSARVNRWRLDDGSI